MSIRLLRGDCRATLATLEPGSVQACVTSPPYYSLRSYGTPDLTWADGWVGSLGLEPDPECFVRHIVECFQAVKRVLRDDGCAFVNFGDSYAGSGKGPTGWNGIGDQTERQGFTDSRRHEAMRQAAVGRTLPTVASYKAKDLLEIPSMVAQALRADGWYLRSRIPWLKRNAMPESVTDRPATSVEYVFLLSKSARYFWDADAVRVESKPDPRDRQWGTTSSTSRHDHSADRTQGMMQKENNGWVRMSNPAGRNRRNGDWFFESWQGLLLDEDDGPLALIVNPAPLKIAHYASFPPKLVEPMIKASTSERGQCPECGAPWVRVVEKEVHANGTGRAHIAGDAAPWKDGWGDVPRASLSVTTVGWRPSCAHVDLAPVPQTILDPFAGSGTTLMVADRLGRNAIGCELSESYSDMGTARVVGDSPMFVQMEGGGIHATG